MDWGLLLITFVAFLFLVYIFFSPRVERFLTGPAPSGSYQLTWSPPVNNGGDPGCCSYGYQVCLASDTSCLSPVLQGTTSSTSFTFPNPAWNTSYVAMVQATNSVGNGPWSSVSFSTGNGTLTSAVFGQQISASGQVTTPLNTSSTQAMIYIAMTGVPSGSVFEVLVTQTAANGGAVGSWTPTPAVTSSSMMITLSPMAFAMGDSLNVSVLITSGGNPIADGSFSTTISASVPGAVQGLQVTYQPPGTVCTTNQDCDVISGMVCNQGTCVPQCMQWYQLPATSQPGFSPEGTTTLAGQQVAPVLAPNPNAPGGVWGGYIAISNGSLPAGTVYGPPIGDETNEIWTPSTVYYLVTNAGCQSTFSLTPASDASDALTFSGTPVCFNFSSSSPAFLVNTQQGCGSFGSPWGQFQLLELQ